MQNHKAQFSSLLLATAFLFGLLIRLAGPLTAAGPVNDGGLFLQMTRDLQDNDFVLPAFTTYNNSNIPFAYPPLGFYLAGILQKLTRISLFDLFTYLPAILSALGIPAFYFLALQLTRDKLKASLAALFYAMIPRSFDWAIMGGGVTRAPAIAFSFLTLAFAHRLFITRDARNILPTSLFAALLTLTHPEITFQTLVSVFILALFTLRGRKSVCHSVAVIVLTTALTSPWWISVLYHHGLAPYQAALDAHPQSLAYSVLYLFQFNLSGEAILAVVAVLGLIGLASNLYRRQFLFPVWIGLSFLTDPRAAPFASLIPMILLAVEGFASTLTGLGLPDQIMNGFQSRAARSVLLGLVAYIFLSGMIASMRLGNELRILPEERQALEWTKQNTPPDSRFLVLTGGAALSDPLSEWFPSLTSRTSVVTVQGHEWTPDSSLMVSLREYHEAQACLQKEPDCIASLHFDYIYIRRLQLNKEGGAAERVSVLERGLQSTTPYTLVYESEAAVIFAFPSQ